jgi:hypothetical protein
VFVVRPCGTAKANREDRVVFRLKDEMEAFRGTLPVIAELANAALKDRHWAEIFKLIGCDYRSDDIFSLDWLMQQNIINKLEEVARISTNASKVGRCRLTVSKPELKARLVSEYSLETKI